ncbi:Response regulator receiver domain-containing protein [Roseovarius nanhaiticus]|uniref:Response regulator receiver domain-containing protein n=1 Tax=Roseovarius nanhaiticus TaxID=573024 RepID=A0A1N7FBS0_9RHOB|nr:response regulator [Roseovarius nanhaiticus]SEK58061.1 Response regulator receiver domain-containing protein [Roseovarius nanhaiticus]SIR97675.1 Response regulator receiver domain-containing protein [Roseovarius nanhaiticus]
MKIIAVDDDGVALDLLNECLQAGDFHHVTLMSSPTDMMKRLNDSAIAYDCILLDIEMPGKDGIQLCAEIRQQPRYKNTPIIMITQNREHAAVERAFSNGATDYITKPFSFFEVLTRIKLAERLVQERRAAMDSYLSMRTNDETGPHLSLVLSDPAEDTARDLAKAKTGKSKVLSLGVFQNYLDQVTSGDTCDTQLFAIKLHRIDEIFANSSAQEFLALLDSAARAVHAEFAPHTIFLAHAGNGILLCACKRAAVQRAKVIAQSLESNLRAGTLPDVCRRSIPLQVSAGLPFRLKPTLKLNFNRASKAAISRVELRDPAPAGNRSQLRVG